LDSSGSPEVSTSTASMIDATISLPLAVVRLETRLPWPTLPLLFFFVFMD
jgi:hypothetical protein